MVHQRFVRPEHLEIPAHRIKEESIKQACRWLEDLKNQRIPKGKLKNIIKFSSEISRMLADTAKDGMPDGADSFFPMVNYALL